MSVMDERLRIIKEKYQELEQELSKPEVLSDFQKLKELSKQKSELEEIVNKYDEYKKCTLDLAELGSMKNDPEMQEMIKEEIDSLEKKKELLYHELEILLIPKDENDGKNIIMEIRGAAGGDEANIFAGDLFRMYSYYAAKQGWKIEVIHSVEGASGGYAQIECMIKGENVYSKLKYESGAHRVQRIPSTETQGRVHTSTATVLVMPEADEVDFQLNMDEVRIDIFCASGPGGQGVNTTKSAIRVTHIPTGIIVQCQDGRSQHENKANALKVLSSRLYDKMMREKAEKDEQERLSKAGHGDRSEKIRTYNYPQNRVTDHRIGFTLQQLDRVMEGKLDPIIDALITEDQKLKLQGQ